MAAMMKIVVLLSCVIPALSAEGYMRVCYYSNAAQYRPMPAKMLPSKIDPNLCTHLIYAFAKLDFKHELNFTEFNDRQLVSELHDLKRENPYLKILLAVGGYNQGNRPFSDLAKDRHLLEKFVRTTIEFLADYDFDGLDFNWEYPGGDGGRKVDKKNYIALLRELKRAIDEGNHKFLLSVAVPSGKTDIDTGFDLIQMTKYVDFFNLMSYDIHGDWEKTAGHNSPLYPRSGETGSAGQLNVDWAANYIVQKGASREKVIVGLPTYGRHYKLANRRQTAVGSRIKRAGKQGPYTKEDGFLAYYEICELLEEGNQFHEEKQEVPYLIHKDHWIGYDDEESFIVKLQYIKDNGFGGASVWSIDLDDFDMLCPHSTRRFHLISAMPKVLGEYIPDNVEQGTQEEDEWTPDDEWTQEEDTDAWGSDNQGTQNEETYTQTSGDYKRVCYFTNWAQYRKNDARYQVKDVDPFLCTHLIYSFAKLENNQIAKIEWNDEQLYSQFNDLKTVNPDLKTLIAIGGWNAGSADYSKLVSNIGSIRQFATSAVTFLRKYGFDGLDLDWEYPAKIGGRPQDKANFITWIKELRKEFDKEEPRLLLTAAVGAGKTTTDVAYDVPEMAKYLDFINLMSYDLHGHWDGYIGHNSPLYAKSGETVAQQRLNVDWAARYWVEKGTPKKKLIIGLPTYGRNYKLKDRNNHDFGDETDGAGAAGSYINAKGFLSYFEVCQRLAKGLESSWDNEHKVPYLVDGDEWIGYDDRESFIVKLGYIRNEGYGGAMVWALDLDDFTGQLCPASNGVKYPLMRLMKLELGEYTGSDDSTPNIDTTDVQETPNGNSESYGSSSGSSSGSSGSSGGTSTGSSSSGGDDAGTGSGSSSVPDSTTNDNGNTETDDSGSSSQPTFDPNVACIGKPSGYYSHPLDCAKYYICSHGTTFVQSCTAGLYWSGQNCNWKHYVNCGDRPRTRSMPGDQRVRSLSQTLKDLIGELKKKKVDSTPLNESETESLDDRIPKHPDMPIIDIQDEVRMMAEMAERDTPYNDGKEIPLPAEPNIKHDFQTAELISELKRDDIMSAEEDEESHPDKPPTSWLNSDEDDDNDEKSDSAEEYIIPLN